MGYKAQKYHTGTQGWCQESQSSPEFRLGRSIKGNNYISSKTLDEENVSEWLNEVGEVLTVNTGKPRYSTALSLLAFTSTALMLRTGKEPAVMNEDQIQGTTQLDSTQRSSWNQLPACMGIGTTG